MNAAGLRTSYSVRGEFGIYTWDLDKSRAMALDGRDPFPVPDSVIEKLLAVNQVEEEHLAHVAPAIERPGIITKIGTRVALIDGSHIFALRKAKGLTCYAYMLSQTESERCLIDPPVQFRHEASGIRRIA